MYIRKSGVVECRKEEGTGDILQSEGEGEVSKLSRGLRWWLHIVFQYLLHCPIYLQHHPVWRPVLPWHSPLHQRLPHWHPTSLLCKCRCKEVNSTVFTHRPSSCLHDVFKPASISAGARVFKYAYILHVDSTFESAIYPYLLWLLPLNYRSPWKYM